jgi:plastocyanin
MSRWMLAGGLVVIVACGGGGDGGTGPGDGGGGGTLVHAARVTATSGIAFDPNAVTIPAGDTIYYTFQTVQHNVVFDTPGNPGDVPNTASATVKRKFPTAGAFNYHCSIHPSMTGTVTVTAVP